MKTCGECGHELPSGGRPPGVTPALTKRICANVLLGVPLKHAAGACGVPYRTFKNWMQMGGQGEVPYCELYAAVQTAQAQAVVELHRRVLAGGKGSGGAQFVLERRYRDYYGPHQKLEMTGADEGPLEHEVSFSFDPVSDPGVRQAIEALLGRTLEEGG